MFYALLAPVALIRVMETGQSARVLVGRGQEHPRARAGYACQERIRECARLRQTDRRCVSGTGTLEMPVQSLARNHNHCTRQFATKQKHTHSSIDMRYVCFVFCVLTFCFPNTNM